MAPFFKVRIVRDHTIVTGPYTRYDVENLTDGGTIEASTIEEADAAAPCQKCREVVEKGSTREREREI